MGEFLIAEGIHPLVITLSGKARVGKDTSAIILAEQLTARGYKVLRLAYADFLKGICDRNFNTNEHSKEVSRPIYQKFGQKVREAEESFWVRTVWNLIDLFGIKTKTYDAFIISDCRYPNELRPYPYNLSYYIANILIKRDFESEVGEQSQKHESEQMASDDSIEFDYVVNADTIEDLEKALDNTLSDFLDVSDVDV